MKYHIEKTYKDGSKDKFVVEDTATVVRAVETSLDMEALKSILIKPQGRWRSRITEEQFRKEYQNNPHAGDV